jgi:hypothetical protein
MMPGIEPVLVKNVVEKSAESMHIANVGVYKVLKQRDMNK